MKVLVVSNMFPDKINPSYGIFVKKFCDNLSRIGVEYETVVMFKGTSKLDKIVKYVLFYFSSFYNCLFKNYDIVYVHYASHSSLGVLLARKLRKFTIYTNLHGSDAAPENASQERMQKYTRNILSKSQKIIVPSEYFRKLVSEKYFLDEKEMVVYPSAGIDKNVFYEVGKDEVSKLKSALKLNPSLKTFGMASRIISKKGWDTFLDAIKLFFDKGCDANFVIVGDGIESSMLTEKIKQLNLETKIVYVKKLVPQKELAVYYSLFDWFVFPSRLKESLGLVAIEAMACGTPVIASDFAAPHYYVEDGINGYKFEVEDAESLANRLIQIISNGESKNSFKNGLIETVARYSEDSVINILEDIFLYEK